MFGSALEMQSALIRRNAPALYDLSYFHNKALLGVNKKYDYETRDKCDESYFERKTVIEKLGKTELLTGEK